MTCENPEPDLLRKVLLPDAQVEMHCRGPLSFLNESGYVGEVADDAFEFRRVANSNEYYQNENVGPPETESHWVRFEDIICIDIFDTPQQAQVFGSCGWRVRDLCSSLPRLRTEPWLLEATD
jgi:hypothetical protein